MFLCLAPFQNGGCLNQEHQEKIKVIWNDRNNLKIKPLNVSIFRYLVQFQNGSRLYLSHKTLRVVLTIFYGSNTTLKWRTFNLPDIIPSVALGTLQR